MPWTKIGFGKHKGKTLPQVTFTDPDYLHWATKESVFSMGALAREFADVVGKAQRIAIPGNANGARKVRYYFRDGKLGNVEVVETVRGPHHGSSQARDKKTFDLLCASKTSAYDKAGGKLIVRSVKYHLFQNADVRLTKAKAEAFFDDPTNFA